MPKDSHPFDTGAPDPDQLRHDPVRVDVDEDDNPEIVPEQLPDG